MADRTSNDVIKEDSTTLSSSSVDSNVPLSTGKSDHDYSMVNTAIMDGENVYTEAAITVDPDTHLYKMVEQKGRPDPSYSVVNTTTMNRDNLYEVAATINTDTHLYEMVEQKGKPDPSYSVVNPTTMNRDNLYEVAATSNAGSKNNQVKDAAKTKKLATSVGVLMLILIFGACFTALFLLTAGLI